MKSYGYVVISDLAVVAKERTLEAAKRRANALSLKGSVPHQIAAVVWMV